MVGLTWMSELGRYRQVGPWDLLSSLFALVISRPTRDAISNIKVDSI